MSESINLQALLQRLDEQAYEQASASKLRALPKRTSTCAPN